MALQGGAAVADRSDGAGPGSDRGNHFGELRHTGTDYNHGKPLRVSRQESEKLAASRPDHPVRVGQTRTWLALDDYKNQIYLKSYKLRGIGDHIEVWVAKDTAFPKGDCRTDLGLTDITDAQVRSFIHEFDTNIYPTESDAFSTPPDRDGSNALLGKHYSGLPRTQFEGDGDNIVVLVDNVRDANFYDPTSPSGQTYIAGFFYSVFNEYTDRNVMTIDAYDWLHRTGANPPDDSEDPAYQACAEELGAGSLGNPRPHLYEGTFAHEYQHLLEYYEDPDEVSWVNEGLSDYAQTLVGYVDPSVPVTDPAADSHIACFAGYMAGEGYGGPENSLTAWGDQGGPEVLCDYGAAYSMMQYLVGHYGAGFMSALHREDANGLEGLQNQLTAAGSTDSAMDVVHRWAATMALDNVVDGGAALTGGSPGDYSEGSLGSQINWQAVYGDIDHDGTADDTGNEAFSTPGAPMNGSDYVRLGEGPVGSRTFYSADQVDSITFDAPAGLPSEPVEWTVDQTPPSGTADTLTCGQDGTATGAPGTVADPALYSGCGANLDRAIVRSVAVPSADSQLTFRTMYDTEPGWDFGFVQVYDPDQGAYVSLSCTDSTSEHDPGAIPAVQDNLPGFSGDSGGWRDETCELPDGFAGQTVDLAFRYVTDSGVNEAGWWVDDVAVDGTPVSDGSDLAVWQSGTEAHPTPVDGFTVQLVAYDSDGSAAWVGQLPVTKGADGFHGELSGADLASAIGTSADTVAALVMQDDPTETVKQYAPYTLTVNGVVQPGGSS
jgi:hypothetical protein